MKIPCFHYKHCVTLVACAFKRYDLDKVEYRLYDY